MPTIKKNYNTKKKKSSIWFMVRTVIQASLGHTVRFCLKRAKQNKKKQIPLMIPRGFQKNSPTDASVGRGSREIPRYGKAP